MKILGEDTDKMNSPKCKNNWQRPPGSTQTRRAQPQNGSTSSPEVPNDDRCQRRRQLPTRGRHPILVSALLSLSLLLLCCTHVVVPLHEPLVHPAEEAIHGLLVRGEGVSPHLRGAEGRGGGGGGEAQSARERAGGGRRSGGGRRDEDLYSVKFG